MVQEQFCFNAAKETFANNIRLGNQISNQNKFPAMAK